MIPEPMEIRVPFQVDLATGRIATVTDPTKIVSQHLVSLIATDPPERVMRPTFGVALRQFLFGPADGAAEAELHDRITSAARRWEPTAVIREMRPVIEAERGVIGFDVRFTLRGDPDMIVSDAFVRVGGSVVETSG